MFSYSYSQSQSNCTCVQYVCSPVQPMLINHMFSFFLFPYFFTYFSLVVFFYILPITAFFLSLSWCHAHVARIRRKWTQQRPNVQSWVTLFGYKADFGRHRRDSLNLLQWFNNSMALIRYQEEEVVTLFPLSSSLMWRGKVQPRHLYLLWLQAQLYYTHF